MRVTLLLAGFYVGVGHSTGEKEETTLAANTPDLIAEPLAEPVYRQVPLTPASWEMLQQHPQFR